MISIEQALLPVSLIGRVKSPFRQNLGAPRQAGLVPDVEQEILFETDFQHPTYWRGLESFSHVWVLFVFHAHRWDPAQACVRPPRLGGAQQMGVFASRAPTRPTPIGMSCCRLLEVMPHGLRIQGGDFLDGTPVVDIKPYLTYCDAHPEASLGWLSQLPIEKRLIVTWSPQALFKLASLSTEVEKEKKVITQTLALDPRSSQDRGTISAKIWRLYLFEYDVHWQSLEFGKALIVDICVPKSILTLT
jgi:tRNA-Thr(GGU) m(6)t(6)A37 methyltransferase TsaA